MVSNEFSSLCYKVFLFLFYNKRFYVGLHLQVFKLLVHYIIINVINIIITQSEQSVRSACDRASLAPLSMASLRKGDQNLLSRAPPCFGRHVKPLVPVAFAVVSTHSSFKEGGRQAGRS
jgi:hypothetical protein